MISSQPPLYPDWEDLAMLLSRRSLLAGTAGVAVAAVVPETTRASGAKTLRMQTRQIEVAGKAATRYGVMHSVSP